jgi:lipid A 3-O-deacylase
MRLRSLLLALLCLPAAAQTTTGPQSNVQMNIQTNALDAASSHQPWEIGAIFQGGVGVTDNRGGFRFLWGGVHVGRVLTNNVGHGFFRGNFEYAGDIFPYFEAWTPVFQRVSCKEPSAAGPITCSAPYNVGGTFHGVSITPITLRWNFTNHTKIQPFAQAAGGLLYTTHKFPSYGNLDTTNYTENGPNGETSVWNFTPQGGVGIHYFTRPNRSIDFVATGMHISSASLGDRNPGVNASVQFSLGYSWWK